MSVKKAQLIVNKVYQELGIDMVAYQNSDLEYLKNQLEDFLELEIETDELSDAEEATPDFEEDEDE